MGWRSLNARFAILPSARSGAAEDQIRAAAEELGVDFPDFHAAFLRRDDGIGPEGDLLLEWTRPARRTAGMRMP